MENILQTADRLFQNRYIISIKKAFTITLPVIILGSIASLINNIPINIVQAGLSTPGWRGDSGCKWRSLAGKHSYYGDFDCMDFGLLSR